MHCIGGDDSVNRGEIFDPENEMKGTIKQGVCR